MTDYENSVTCIDKVKISGEEYFHKVEEQYMKKKNNLQDHRWHFYHIGRKYLSSLCEKILQVILSLLIIPDWVGVKQNQSSLMGEGAFLALVGHPLVIVSK